MQMLSYLRAFDLALLSGRERKEIDFDDKSIINQFAAVKTRRIGPIGL